MDAPRGPWTVKTKLIFMGLDHEWEARIVTVPDLAGTEVVGCWQAVNEDKTMDCFYVGTDPDTVHKAKLYHLAMDPKDVPT